MQTGSYRVAGQVEFAKLSEVGEQPRQYEIIPFLQEKQVVACLADTMQDSESPDHRGVMLPKPDSKLYAADHGDTRHH